MIAIIDYGVGNLRSVQKALQRSGGKDVRITCDPADIKAADKVVLPGVGAIGAAMERLNALDLVGPVKDAIGSGKPFLGICVGFQLLFEKSFEFGETDCLGCVPGVIERFHDAVKVPQMGWNGLKMTTCPLWKGLPEQTDVYFCHSFYAKPKDTSVIAAETHYGITYCSAVWKENIFGVQFHPEKSQTAGLKILENFVEY